jgi:hypothetical protein
MTDKQPPRTAILPSDIDSQGNVVLWDHGPTPPTRKFPNDTEEQAQARAARYEDQVRAWRAENGDMAVRVVMSSGDAGHAMTVEPGRYALEPDDIDEAEVEKRVKAMKDKREAARDFAQSVIDRKTAIAEIMSERAAAATAAAIENEPRPEPGLVIRPQTTDPALSTDNVPPSEEKPVV